MFDLITGKIERPLRERSPRSKAVAAIGHVVAVALVIGIPLMRVTNTIPDVPTMMAFVAPSVPTPPPPPPPPPPVGERAAVKPEPVKDAGPNAAPIDAPSDIRPEAPRSASTAGVEGGVEGGMVGGVAGGIVGGLVAAAPPPPPPPPAPQAPVRVGGQITAPALVTRVEPTYPDLARMAHVTGIVILEAVVDTEGCVESVTVLRPSHRLLDEAAIAALKQWRYTPLNLNGVPTRFVLTVTFSFSEKK